MLAEHGVCAFTLMLGAGMPTKPGVPLCWLKRGEGAFHRFRARRSRRAGGNTLKGFNDFRTENGSNQGQSLALTVLFVPNLC